VLECWTVLSALAVDVPRIALGPLVLNPANRDPGTLAVMVATLQEVSAGRLMLGLGAGARAGTEFAIEQEALGRVVPGAPDRRRAVADGVVLMRQVWSGAVPPAGGFLRPQPPPPIVIAGLGPRMAELAGSVGDGICLPVGPRLAELVSIARRACARSGRDPSQFVVAATVPLASSLLSGPQPWFEVGVDRLIVYLRRPFEEGVARLRGMLQT
jgi:alkanesulfonate monooxygenase SsuD/methylene tetrahydromethanopterin reductase-like flavin-dependent oxidoreductase (luciferase family)